MGSFMCVVNGKHGEEDVLQRGAVSKSKGEDEDEEEFRRGGRVSRGPSMRT